MSYISVTVSRSASWSTAGSMKLGLHGFESDEEKERGKEDNVSKIEILTGETEKTIGQRPPGS